MSTTTRNVTRFVLAVAVLLGVGAQLRAEGDLDDLGELTTESKLAPFDWEPLITRFIVLPRSAAVDDDGKEAVGAPLKLEKIPEILPSVKAAWEAIVPRMATRVEAYTEKDMVPSSFELRTETSEDGKRIVSPYMHLADGSDKMPIQSVLASEDVTVSVNIDVLLTHSKRDEILKNFEVMEMSVLAYRFPAEEKNVRAKLGAPLPDARGDIDDFDKKAPKPQGVMMIGGLTNTNIGDRFADAVDLLERTRGEYLARTPGIVEFRIRLRIRGTIEGVEQTKMASGAIRVRFVDQKVGVDVINKADQSPLTNLKKLPVPKADPGPAGTAAGGGTAQ